MFGLQTTIEKAARKAAAFSAAGLLACVGVGFLTTAGWLVLVELRSPVYAATVIGGIYLGAAAIALAIGITGRQKSPHYAAQQAQGDLSPMQLVAVSFLQGLEQGRQSRRR